MSATNDNNDKLIDYPLITQCIMSAVRDNGGVNMHRGASIPEGILNTSLSNPALAQDSIKRLELWLSILSTEAFERTVGGEEQEMNEVLQFAPEVYSIEEGWIKGADFLTSLFEAAV